jgi:hypothetical protein
MSLAHRRVVLKLSGEALMGDADYGIDPAVIGRLAQEVVEAQQAGAVPGRPALYARSKPPARRCCSSRAWRRAKASRRRKTTSTPK